MVNNILCVEVGMGLRGFGRVLVVFVMIDMVKMRII